MSIAFGVCFFKIMCTDVINAKIYKKDYNIHIKTLAILQDFLFLELLFSFDIVITKLGIEHCMNMYKQIRKYTN